MAFSAADAMPLEVALETGAVQAAGGGGGGVVRFHAGMILAAARPVHAGATVGRAGCRLTR